MIEFKKVNYEEIRNYRNAYLDSIYEAQELYLEWLVQKADYYIIMADETEQTAGYVIVAPENILVEFFLLQDYIKDCELIFETITKKLNVKKVYCKSFDSLLLKCSLINSASQKIIGTLFRDFIDTNPDNIEEFQIRRAVNDDIPYLLLQRDGLYESEEELLHMFRDSNIIMYFLNDQLIGCGYLIKIIEGRKFYDIGMWVKSKFRQKGYATRIIANLKAYCLKNNLKPICGCAADNIASRKTLEKNGFFSKHDLIEFQLK